METLRKPTLREVERLMRRAERMRSRAMGQALLALLRPLRRGGTGLVRLLGGAGRGDEAAALLRSPLTAMRCAAEILRDNPDLPPAERSRFVQVLLAEERRMEELIAGLLEPRHRGTADR